jgi:Glycosyltransferase
MSTWVATFRRVRIYGWVADRQGCGWYRVALPLYGLREWGGHEVGASERMLKDPSTMDVIIGQRVCLPGPSTVWQDLCRRGDVATVYEVDDDLLNVDPSSEAAYAFYARADIRANIAANAACADMVTVSTPVLAEVMSAYNSNVVVLPNALDGGLFDHARPRRGRLTVGWAGSATHRMDLTEAASGVRQFLRRHPDVDMHFIGEDYSRLIAGTDTVLAGRIRHTGWRLDIAAYYATLDFDIGIAPLRPHVFNRSKTAVKILEYSALGIPWVASDVGPYHDHGPHGGVLVRYPHEWPRVLGDLAADESMRVELGAKAKEYARRWAISERWRAWETAYTTLVSGRVAA